MNLTLQTTSIDQPHILLISDIPPAYGSGSGIVLLRHLQRLVASGIKVSLCVPFRATLDESVLPSDLRVIRLPSRLWWYPPVREGLELSLILRSALYARLIRRILGRDTPTHVLTLLWEEAPRVAQYVSCKLKIPLITIVHDCQEHWPYKKNKSAIIRKRSQSVVASSDKLLCVSKEIIDFYKSNHKGSILYPIPGELKYFQNQQRHRNNEIFRVFFGGSLHPWQLPNFLALAQALENHGGHLVILTEPDNEVWKRLSAEFPQSERKCPPLDNEDAVRLVANEADAFLVSYSMSATSQPWGRSSFPSKLLDFSRAGIPIIVLGPPGTAISNWCKDVEWLTFLDSIDKIKIESIVSDLQDKEFYRSAQNQVRQFCNENFLATKIQEELQEEFYR